MTLSTTIFEGHGRRVVLDKARDVLLTDFGKKTLENNYLLAGETYQELFGRVACAYSDDDAHAQRLYEAISKLWFVPATPILANGGTERGLPISCFLNEAEDTLDSISKLWMENVWLGARGGGIGSYWGNVRPIGEGVGLNYGSSGIIPFIKVMESITLAIGQGSLRRGVAAVYLSVDHPEIEEFIELRQPTGGDPSRKSLHLHHGVVISDAFMEAVRAGSDWALISPKSKKIMRTVPARELWIRLLSVRVATGEPYLFFVDAANRAAPPHHKLAGLTIKTSNLCNEITLPTAHDRTAVCCLSSVNLELWDTWSVVPSFIEDLFRFLDNVLQDFIDRAPDTMERARYSAMRERSVGMGVMGFHAFLQSKNVAFESLLAKSWNVKIFTHLHEEAKRASKTLAKERGACPDAADYGFDERFSYTSAAPPTASTAIICNTSPGIEPYYSNAYLHKTLSGSFSVRNPHLVTLLKNLNRDASDVWSSIFQNHGSVQHLSFLTDAQKAVFKTAFEIDQTCIVRLAADRTPLISQGQSLNLFVPSDIHKKALHDLHFMAWESGCKGLYYLRSLSVQRAEGEETAKTFQESLMDEPKEDLLPLDFESCRFCS